MMFLEKGEGSERSKKPLTDAWQSIYGHLYILGPHVVRGFLGFTPNGMELLGGKRVYAEVMHNGSPGRRVFAFWW